MDQKDVTFFICQNHRLNGFKDGTDYLLNNL